MKLSVLLFGVVFLACSVGAACVVQNASFYAGNKSLQVGDCYCLADVAGQPCFVGVYSLVNASANVSFSYAGFNQTELLSWSWSMPEINASFEVRAPPAPNSSNKNISLSNAEFWRDDGLNLSVFCINASVEVEECIPRIDKAEELGFCEDFFDYDLNLTVKAPCPKLNSVKLQAGEELIFEDFNLVTACNASCPSCPVFEPCVPASVDSCGLFCQEVACANFSCPAPEVYTNYSVAPQREEFGSLDLVLLLALVGFVGFVVYTKFLKNGGGSVSGGSILKEGVE